MIPTGQYSYGCAIHIVVRVLGLLRIRLLLGTWVNRARRRAGAADVAPARSQLTLTGAPHSAQRVITLLGSVSQDLSKSKGHSVMNVLCTSSHTCRGALGSSKGSGKGTSAFRSRRL